MPPKRPPKKGSGAAAAAAEAAEAEAAGEMDTAGPPVAVSKADLSGDAYAELPPLFRTHENCGYPVFFGSTNWSIMSATPAAKKAVAKKPKGADEEDTAAGALLGPHRLKGTGDTLIRRVATSSAGTSFALVSKSGALFVFGRNDLGQLGLGHNRNVSYPYLVPSLVQSKVINVAVGRRHMLALTAEGQVFACGDNRCGQLGLNNQTNKDHFTKINFGGKVKRIACGAEFSMMVDTDGQVWAFGHPEYGQLGNGADGKYFVSANRLSFNWQLTPRLVDKWIDKDKQNRVMQLPDKITIMEITCGNNHTVVLDDKGCVYTWGFGGYGRLGHADNKDEMFPRRVALFAQLSHGVAKIAAGATFSLAVTKHKMLYLWGQQGNRGEANMYPKPIHDLAGYNIATLAGGMKHVVLQADDMFVSWAAAPCYGELGLGESALSKSSTKPNIVETMSGIVSIDLAAGYATTLTIANEASKAKVDALPSYGTDS